MTAIHFVQNVVFSTPFPPQHCLYFFPLPQGQGSLRSVFAVFMTTRPPADPLPPTASLPRTHTTEKRYGTPRFSGAFVARARHVSPRRVGYPAASSSAAAWRSLSVRPDASLHIVWPFAARPVVTLAAVEGELNR